MRTLVGPIIESLHSIETFVLAFLSIILAVAHIWENDKRIVGNKTS